MNTGLREILREANDDDFVLTLNDDTTFDSAYLDKLIKAAGKYPNYCIGTTYTCDNEHFETETKIDWHKYNYYTERCNLKALEKSEDVLLNCDTLPARGVLIPVKVFRKIGNFDEIKLPHYAADYDFFFRAKSAGFPLAVSTRAITYDTKPHKKQGNKRKFFDYLFGMRSPSNIGNHILIIARHCPSLWLKLLNLARVVIGSPIAYLLK
jgi:GT2 family glycosyltransferase